jgi:hypothetical protein
MSALLLSGCGVDRQGHPNRSEHLTGKTLTETLEENRAHLLSLPGVLKVEPADCGVDSCIKVTVSNKDVITMNQLPQMLETFQVQVVQGQ